jgi:hypothetical protein
MRKDSRKSRKPKWRSAPLVRGKLSSKTKGELGELAFSHKAACLGFGVAKPNGEDEAYDFILDSGQRLWRVQVKSIYTPFRDGFRAIGQRTNKEPYTAKEIDFLVVYVAPLNILVCDSREAFGAVAHSDLLPLGMQARRRPLRALARSLAFARAGRGLEAAPGDIATATRHGL